MVHEEYPYGSDLRDARTGEILLYHTDRDDTEEVWLPTLMPSIAVVNSGA